jgi:hypothetical protein
MKRTMRFSIQLLSLGLSSLLATACATHAQQTTAKNTAACDGDRYSDSHGVDTVGQLKFQDQVIYSYRNYFFTQQPAQNLAEFIKQHSVQIVIDLRIGTSEKDLPENYPAVYWGHPIEDLAKLDYKNIQELEEHLETFSDKTILFVSTSADAAAASFTNYWANANSLNEKWITRTATELGLKDQAWLKKWSELEENASAAADQDNADRSSASEAKPSK